MLTRFAFICDCCGKRGPEYEPMLACRVCGDDCCLSCTADPGEDWDEGTSRAKALCKQCAKLEIEAAEHPSQRAKRWFVTVPLDDEMGIRLNGRAPHRQWIWWEHIENAKLSFEEASPEGTTPEEIL